jgi:hypothetical protein
MAPQTPMGLGSGSLSATFGTAEAGLQLDSSVTQLNADSYRYSYDLTNTTDETVTIDWDAAALSATLAPGQTLNHAVVSGRIGRQANGNAILTGVSFADVSIVANALVPIPEPNTAGLALGLTFLRWWRWPRARRVDAAR